MTKTSKRRKITPLSLTNPPHDATDPEEWRLFFRYNFKDLHTTCCTIAVDNDLLVRALMKRRECMRKIEMLVEPGTSLDTINLARIAMEIQRKRTFFSKIFAMIVPGIPELYGQVTVLTAQVQGLAQQDYPVHNVFLTFETEAAQRQVLTALSVGSRATKKNDVSVMKDNPTYLFRGTTLLRVEEPEEPSTVRWQDLNAKWFARVKELAMTTLATFAAIGVIAVLIWKLHGVQTTMGCASHCRGQFSISTTSEASDTDGIACLREWEANKPVFQDCFLQMGEHSHHHYHHYGT